MLPVIVLGSLGGQNEAMTVGVTEVVLSGIAVGGQQTDNPPLCARLDPRSAATPAFNYAKAPIRARVAPP